MTASTVTTWDTRRPSPRPKPRALAIVAKGGAADIHFREQAQAGAALPIAASGMRTMEFRPGSTPVVR